MEINSKSYSSDQFTYPTEGYINKEKAWMITESRIDHIESLAKRAEKFEKSEPKWDVLKLFMTGAATMWFSILGIFATKWLSPNEIYINETANWVLWLIFWVSLISSILSFYMAHSRDKLRTNECKSFITEIINILEKIKKPNESARSS